MDILTAMKQSKLTIFSLPEDILLRCILSYLRRTEQYDLFSTCKICRPLLLMCRTVLLASYPKKNKPPGPQAHVCWWETFCTSPSLQRQILNTIGYNDSAYPASSPMAGLRKIQAQIDIEAVFSQSDLLLTFVQFFHKLEFTTSRDSTYYDKSDWFPYSSLIPVVFDNPTVAMVGRWLKSAEVRFDLEEVGYGLQYLHLWVEAQAQRLLNNQPNHPSTAVHSTTPSLAKVKGIHRLCIDKKTTCFIEFNGIEENEEVARNSPLQCVVLHNCSTMDELSFLQDIPQIRLIDCAHTQDIQALSRAKDVQIKSCKSLSNVSPLANVMHVLLNRLDNVTDISMLGNIQFLTIKQCRQLRETNSFPMPLRNDQIWTFVDLEMKKVNFQHFANLQKLVVQHCYISDLSMLSYFDDVELSRCTKTNTSFYIAIGKVRGKIYLDTYERLKSAVNMWCKNEATAMAIFGDIATWDVSRVKRMRSLFHDQREFNSNINGWDVSNVEDMSLMFQPTKFNQPLASWRVSQVCNMQAMFQGASSFNQSLNSWNVKNVTDMSKMFHGAFAFNQPLDSWCVDHVRDMSEMFYWAKAFNQPLVSWNVCNVSNMKGMFQYTPIFQQSLHDWNVSNVTNMSHMFHGASAFNHPLNSWNTSNVKDMSSMFEQATAFNQPLDLWDISKVVSMRNMFHRASYFQQSLDLWKVNEKVTDIRNIGVLLKSCEKVEEESDNEEICRIM